MGLLTATFEGNIDCEGGPLGGTEPLGKTPGGGGPGRETGGPPAKGGGCWPNGVGYLGALAFTFALAGG